MGVDGWLDRMLATSAACEKAVTRIARGMSIPDLRAALKIVRRALHSAAMNTALRIFAAVTLLAGCSKKEDAQIAEASEQALPPEERVEPAPPAAPAAAESPAPPKPTSLATGNEFATEAKAFENWCKKYALDANDPAMLDADPDGDGFPNREEFVGNSNPLDPKSRPGIHAEMRLKEYREVRLPVVLETVEGDKAFLKQIEGGGDAKPQAVKAGDSVGGLKVARVRTRRDFDKGGNPIDISNVTLEDPATKEKVTLVKGLPARTAATSAVIASADGKRSITVKQGETFEWPGTPGTHYTVVDMSEDQVVVQQVDDRTMWTIPRE